MKLLYKYYYNCTNCGREHLFFYGDHCSLKCKQERDSNVSSYRRIYAEHEEELAGRTRVRNKRNYKDRKAELHAYED